MESEPAARRPTRSLRAPPSPQAGRDQALRASAPSIMSTVFCSAIDRDEGAEARALLLAEQHLVEHVEPVERDARLAVLGLLLLVEERLAAADLVDDVLDLLRRSVGRQIATARRADRSAPCARLRSARGISSPAARSRGNSGWRIPPRVELGMRLRRHARPVAADEAPQRLGVLRVRRRHQRQQHRERDRHVGLAADGRNGCARPDLTSRCLPSCRG